MGLSGWIAPMATLNPFAVSLPPPESWARVGQMLIHEGKVGDKQVVPARVDSENGKTLLLWNPPLVCTFWIKARTDEYPQVNRGSSAAFIADDTFYLDGYHHQRVYIIPSHDLVIVRIGEEPSAWDDSVIPNALVAGLRR